MPPTNGLSEPHQNISLAFSWNYGEKYTARSPRGSKRLVQRARDGQAVIRKRRVEVRELLHDDLSGRMFGRCALRRRQCIRLPRHRLVDAAYWDIKARRERLARSGGHEDFYRDSVK